GVPAAARAAPAPVEDGLVEVVDAIVLVLPGLQGLFTQEDRVRRAVGDTREGSARVGLVVLVDVLGRVVGGVDARVDRVVRDAAGEPGRVVGLEAAAAPGGAQEGREGAVVDPGGRRVVGREALGRLVDVAELHVRQHLVGPAPRPAYRRLAVAQAG